MKWWILLLLPVLAWGQEFPFEQEIDTIPVEINSWKPFAPWTGGDSETAPEFCDIDADGDFDCFVGNKGYRLTYFENIGTADSAQYKYRTRFFGEIFIDSLYTGRLDPCFVDIDADGDFDLFSSCFKGLVHYWENVGTAQSPQFIKITDSLDYIDVPGPASLTLWDIDADDDGDLFIADNGGYIHYYQNVGTPEVFDFSLITTQFQNIDVGERASPCFVDIDADGDADLFIGNYIGRIWYYRNDSVLPSLQFTLVTNYYDSIDVVDYASPDFVDLDGDGDQDMAVGRNVSYPSAPTYGDVAFYRNVGTAQLAEWALLSEEYLTWDIGSSLGYHGTDIDADFDYDIFIMLRYCDCLAYYENIGTPEAPSFLRVTDNYQDIHVNGGTPFFADIDNDQDADLFIGEGVIPNPPYPGLYFYENIGDPQHAVFNLVSEDLVPWNYDAAIRPALADIDADGDKDLFLADNDGVYYFFENTGTSTQPNFGSPVLNWQGINAPGLPMSFADIDQDGDFDLFLSGPNWNDLWFYRNVGTCEVPAMQFVTQNFLGNDVELFLPSGIDYTDIDADGDGDFLFSSQRGGMLFFRNVTGQNEVGPKRPYVPYPKLDFSIGPNPANPVTWISFSLPSPQEATLAVYNILGAKVITLASGLQMPGTHNVIWNASQYSSGLYIIRLETPTQSLAKTLTIIR